MYTNLAQQFNAKLSQLVGTRVHLAKIIEGEQMAMFDFRHQTYDALKKLGNDIKARRAASGYFEIIFIYFFILYFFISLSFLLKCLKERKDYLVMSSWILQQ